MGPARPCIGDSSRGLGALDERRDVGPGFLAPGRTVRRDVVASPPGSLTAKSPRGRHSALQCGDPTDSWVCFAGRFPQADLIHQVEGMGCRLSCLTAPRMNNVI